MENTYIYGKCYVTMTTHLLIWKCDVAMTRTKALTFIFESFFNFHSQKSTRFFQLPAFYLDHPWPTTLQKLWTNWLAPTMWTLASVKTDLDDFLGPKMTPTTWILN